MNFLKRNKKQIVTIGVVGVGSVMIVAAIPKAGILVFSGCALGMGFWLSKKITNKIDELWLTTDSSLARIQQEIGL